MEKIKATEMKEISNREKLNQVAVRSMAPEGAVLLENHGGLPLNKQVKKIALFGNGARRTVKGGTGSGDVNSRHVVSIEEGLENAGYEITTKAWLDEYDRLTENAYQERVQLMREKLAKTKNFIDVIFGTPENEPAPQQITKKDVTLSDTNTAIYVIARKSGEGADRKDEQGDYRLSDAELHNLQFLGTMYEDVVVLLNVGGPIQSEPLKSIPGLSAILLVSQAGNVIGDVVADILRGVSYPSGKLTATWAKDYKDYPFSEEFSSTGGNYDDSFYKEGIFVGYRYFDTYGVEPSYCFGYGKGYTDFDVKLQDIEADKNEVKIICSVQNIGKEYAGKEVVQVYYSAPAGDIAKPYQELIAFGKSEELQPGEKSTVTLTFQMEDMASYSEKRAAWVLEKGSYVIHVGTSSRDTIEACILELDKTVILEQLQNLFTKDIQFEEMGSELYGSEHITQQDWKVVRFPVNSELFATKEKVEYTKIKELPKTEATKVITIQDVLKKDRSIEELVSQLSVEELILLCVGIGYKNLQSGTSIIGSAAINVPGAAGETTSQLYETRGIPNIVLADGPAGLRLLPEFSIDKEGNMLQGGIAIPLFADLFGEREEPEQKQEPYKTFFQYCTAIPIATMLAQSWNEDMISKCGTIVGQEMKELGVTLWLAPGMNIQRNPLCGRNFEYYSEDPMLAGTCAAAETRGVQSHKGAGVTIKHFACNNQEENREFSNSHVSERALREIYLKGFELCVKKAEPMAIMTSYNLINGIHAANNHDLLYSCLRDEWKFDGVVMTDWGTTQNRYIVDGKNTKKYEASSPDLCIAAGNDLIMPGTDEDMDGIREAYEKGTLSLGQLQFCAMNVLKTIIKSME